MDLLLQLLEFAVWQWMRSLIIGSYMEFSGDDNHKLWFKLEERVSSFGCIIGASCAEL